MKKAGYVFGYFASLWMLFALWVRVMTLGDIAPVVQPYYDGIAPLINVPAVWLLLSAAIACGSIVRLFRGECSRAKRVAALVLTLLCLISAFGWAVITALTAAA